MSRARLVRMSRTRRVRLASALAVGAALLSSCGGGDSESVADALVDPATQSDATADAEPVDLAETLPQPEPGPLPEGLPIRPASEPNLLPDVAIRRLNGDGGWENLKNILPAEKPLLVWFWAPW